MTEDLKRLYRLILNYNYYVFDLDKTHKGSVVITLKLKHKEAHKEVYTWILILEPQG